MAWAMFLALWALPGAAWAQIAPNDKTFQYPPLNECGLITRHHRGRIPPNCLTEALNLAFDEDSTASRRHGQAKLNSTACLDSKSIRGLWPFKSTGGNRYLVINSSTSMFYITDSGTCTQIAGITLTSTAEVDCVQTIGRLWCVNGTESPFSWDGTSTDVPTGMPNGNLVGAYRNRVLVADVAGALTRVRLSGELNGEDWTVQIPGVSTTPANVDISGTHDGWEVTCLLGEFQNQYIIGREYDLWGLSGYSRDDFALRNISHEIGCIDDRTVQEQGNGLVWLSRRGIEKLIGPNINTISDPIRPTIDQVIDATANDRQFIDTTQGNFEAGNVNAAGQLSRLNTTNSPANITISTWSASDDTASEFAAGTLTNMRVSTNGYVYIGTYTAIVSNGDFEAGSGGWSYSRTGQFVQCSGGTNMTWSTSTTGALEGSVGMRVVMPGCYAPSGICVPTTSDNNDLTALYLQDGNGSTIFADSLGTGGINTRYGESNGELADLQALGTDYMRIALVWQNNGLSYLYSPYFQLAESQNIYLSTSVVNSAGTGCTGQDRTYVLDFIRRDGVYFSTGTLLSGVFDTTFSTPIGGQFNVTLTSSTDQDVDFFIQSATSTSGTWGGNTAINGGDYSTQVRRYWRYLSSFTVTDIDPEVPTLAILSTVTLQAATTGTFISQCHNPGTSISSFGVFACNLTTLDGSWSLAITTAATCNPVIQSTAVWVSQTNNQPIGVGVGNFVAWRAIPSFTQFVSSTMPRLHDCTINWSAGANRPPSASAVYEDRYYFYYTTTTAGSPHNEFALVYDADGKWSKHNNINAYSAAIYNNKLYTGDTQDTGTIFQQDTGHADDGGDYLFLLKTADHDFGAPFKTKLFKYIYVSFESENSPGQNIVLSARYYIDGSTTSYSLGSINLNEGQEPGLFTAKAPFPEDQKTDGHWLSLELEYNGDEGPIKLLGVNVIYEELEPD